VYNCSEADDVKRPVFWMLLFLAAALPAPSRAAAKAGFGADEIKMGQEAAKEVERQSKLVTDEKTRNRTESRQGLEHAGRHLHVQGAG